MVSNTVLACFIGKPIILLSSRKRDRLEWHSGCVLPKKLNRQGYDSCRKCRTYAGISNVGPVKVTQTIGMHDYVPSATTCRNTSDPEIEKPENRTICNQGLCEMHLVNRLWRLMRLFQRSQVVQRNGLAFENNSSEFRQDV